MADTTNQKILNTRIRLKYDSYENWTTNNPKLLAGEVALVYVPASKVAEVGEHNLTGTTPPHVLMKVGDGTSNFNSLKYVSALAADVNSYAKMKDTDFEAQVKSFASAELSEDIQANAEAIEALKALVGTEAVTTQITNAIAALNLANTYVAKESGKSLVSNTEITKLTTVSEGANKVEASTNGKIKIDGVDTTVYTHPDKHTITEVDGLQTALDGKSNTGHKHVSADITDLDDTIKGYDYATKTEAQGYANAKDGAIAAAQKKADDITTYVGTFTASEGVDTVVKYIDAKTANIASDERVNSLENRIKTVEDDYLVEADKTELSTAINTEKERAEGIESGLRTDVDAIKSDYLKAADKTELSNAIATEKGRAEGVEASLQNQINTIINNPDAEGAINSINEFTQYIADHGEIAEGFRTDINKNKEDISAINDPNTGILKQAKTYADGLNTSMDTRVKVLEEINHDAYIAADTALKSELEGKINAIDNHSHTNKTVLDGITAQNITDWNDAVAKEHEHSNKALLDTYTQTEANLADAVSKKHSHTFVESELNKIKDGDVAKWNAEIGAKELAASKTTTAEVKTQIEAYTYATEDYADQAEADAKAYTDKQLESYTKTDDLGELATKDSIDRITNEDQSYGAELSIAYDLNSSDRRGYLEFEDRAHAGERVLLDTAGKISIYTQPNQGNETGLIKEGIIATTSDVSAAEQRAKEYVTTDNLAQGALVLVFNCGDSNF